MRASFRMSTVGVDAAESRIAWCWSTRVFWGAFVDAIQFDDNVDVAVAALPIDNTVLLLLLLLPHH